jgi:hypothetical protein
MQSGSSLSIYITKRLKHFLHGSRFSRGHVIAKRWLTSNGLRNVKHRPALGLTQSSIQWVLGALSPGIKWPGHEADHSPLTSTKVKKTWVYTSTLPYVFMV